MTSLRSIPSKQKSSPQKSKQLLSSHLQSCAILKESWHLDLLSSLCSYMSELVQSGEIMYSMGAQMQIATSVEDFAKAD